MQRPIAEKGEICPLHKKDVSRVCHTCPWFVNVQGKNPQSEEIIDRWGCAIAWGPAMALETSQQVRQSTAATDALRKEAGILGTIGAKQTQEFLHMMHSAQMRLEKKDDRV